MTPMQWDIDGKTWPNAGASRFVARNGFRWHVQTMGEGPDMLLLHGTGASTHSWRKLMPLLAGKFRLIVPDLPGHGFSIAPPEHNFTLPGMAQALSGLLSDLEASPTVAIGHSAGAAIACEMCLNRAIAPDAIVSVNGALLPFRGFASTLFPMLARALFLNPFASPFLSWRAHDPKVVRHLIQGTGSNITEEDLALYSRLFQSGDHVRAALRMMANWDLHALERRLPQLKGILTLIAGSVDKAIPPEVAFRVKEIVPKSRVTVLRGLGHLAHEEDPERVADVILGRERLNAAQQAS